MKMLKAGKESSWLHSELRIMLATNNICNFSCSYCVNARARMDKGRFISQKTLELFMHKIASLRKETYIFRIAGGEPLLYPHLDTLLDCCDKEMGGKVDAALSTNGFFLPKRQHLFNKMHNTTVGIVISTHLEQLSVDDYINILRRLDNKKNIKVKIMLPPGMLDQVRRLQEFCEANEFKYVIHALTLNGKLHPSYTEEEISFIPNKKSHSKSFFYSTTEAPEETCFFSRVDAISNTELINYTGMHCSAGFSSICMNAEEKISCCFKSPRKDFSIEELENMLSGPTLCPSNRCACPALFALPKWLNPEDAPEYIKNRQMV